MIAIVLQPQLRRRYWRWTQGPIAVAGLLCALLPVPSHADAGRGAHFVCDAPVHDFGAVAQGTVVRHVFRLRNDGDKALRITEVSAPCGCAVALLPDRPVPPGEEGAIEVAFDTSHFRGRKTKSVFVSTNDPSQSLRQLTLTGDVTAEVVADPPVLYLGRVHPGTNTTAEIRLISTSGMSLEGVGAAAENPSIRLEVEPLEGSGDTGRRIVVRIEPDMPRGSFSDIVRIAATGPSHAEMEVPVLGIVEGDLVVQPSYLTLKGWRRGGRHQLRIQNLGNEPIAIAGVRVPNLPLDYAVRTVSPGYEYQITLRLAGPIETVQPREMVHIYTTHPDEPEVVVPIYATVHFRRG